VLVARIKAHVVGVRRELSRLHELKRDAVEDLHGAVARGGHEQVVGSGIEVGLLGVVEIWNRVNLLERFPLPAILEAIDCAVCVGGRARWAEP
jgi:hypothetical protein